MCLVRSLYSYLRMWEVSATKYQVGTDALRRPAMSLSGEQSPFKCVASTLLAANRRNAECNCRNFVGPASAVCSSRSRPLRCVWRPSTDISSKTRLRVTSGAPDSSCREAGRQVGRNGDRCMYTPPSLCWHAAGLRSSGVDLLMWRGGSKTASA